MHHSGFHRTVLGFAASLMLVGFLAACGTTPALAGGLLQVVVHMQRNHLPWPLAGARDHQRCGIGAATQGDAQRKRCGSEVLQRVLQQLHHAVTAPSLLGSGLGVIETAIALQPIVAAVQQLSDLQVADLAEGV